MSLRKLAGPFPVVRADGSAVFATSCIGWIPKRGIMLSAGETTGICTLDGVYAPIGDLPNVSASVVGFWPEKQQWLWFDWVPGGDHGFEFSIEPILLGLTFLRQRFITGTRFVRLQDRYIYQEFSGASGRVRAITEIDGIAQTNTVEFTGFPTAWYLNGPGRKKNEVLLVNQFSPSDFAFYDTDLKQLASQHFYLGESTTVVMYAPEFNVVVSFHGDFFTQGSVNVWSLETKPDHITTPVLIDGELKAGHVATFRVQVLGDHNEICIGETVDWSIVSGPGKLLDLQSETDDSGYATARVLFAIDADASVVLEADCTC